MAKRPRPPPQIGIRTLASTTYRLLLNSISVVDLNQRQTPLLSGFRYKHLLGKLVERSVLSPNDARDIIDESLLMLESHQKSFPEAEDTFQEARDFIEPFVNFYGGTTNPQPRG